MSSTAGSPSLRGPTIRPPSGRALPGFVLRWLVGLGALLGWACWFESTTLKGYETIPMGALYFATLASAELLAAYEDEDALRIE